MSCNTNKCICYRNEIECNEDSCGCTSEACKNPKRHEFNDERVGQFRQQRLKELELEEELIPAIRTRRNSLD